LCGALEGVSSQALVGCRLTSAAKSLQVAVACRVFMATWRTKACALFDFPAGEYSFRRGKVDLFRDLLEIARRAIAENDETLLTRISEYVVWAASQKSAELDSAVDLAFLLPLFQDATLCSKLRRYLPEELLAAKWQVLMQEPA
jgi:hypothetical protein